MSSDGQERDAQEAWVVERPEIRMRDYMLRLFRKNGEPALIYRTQDEGDDWVLAKLLRIRNVQYDHFEILCEGRKIADGPAATRLDEYGVLGTWPRAIRRLSSSAS